MPHDLPYHRDVGAGGDLDPETCIVLDWIGEDKRVLELGCHSGALARALAERGCVTTGVELNERALDAAIPHLEAAIAGDLEDAATWSALDGRRFDAITFIHVLEHLRDPAPVLRRAHEHLEAGGVVIVALPNICNARDRLAILRGRFDYTDHGVMDRTHLRFFTQRTARELIAEAGFEITGYEAPLRVNPLAELADHLPLLHRARHVLARRKTLQGRFSPTLTDVVMLLRCRPAG